MSSSYEAMERCWFVLSKIPRYPKTVSVRDIQAKLQDDGIQSSVRMIQRDLNFLSSISLFPITNETIGKKHIWFWPLNSVTVTLPTMSSDVALSLYLVKEYLMPMIPPHLFDDLLPYFERAESTLDARSTKASNWREKIIRVSPGPSFHVHSANKDNINLVYQAVLREQKIKTEYANRGGVSKDYLLSPLGLTVKGPRVYLVAENERGQIKQYFLNRFLSVEILSESVSINKGFCLADYVKVQGMFDYPKSKGDKKVTLLVNEEFRFYFNETSLGQNQTIQKASDNQYLVASNMLLTEELIWWLAGRADVVEVLSPPELRAEVLQLLTKGLSNYA